VFNSSMKCVNSRIGSRVNGRHNTPPQYFPPRDEDSLNLLMNSSVCLNKSPFRRDNKVDYYHSCPWPSWLSSVDPAAYAGIDTFHKGVECLASFSTDSDPGLPFPEEFHYNKDQLFFIFKNAEPLPFVMGSCAHAGPPG
jgi:hypothetical protein